MGKCKSAADEGSSRAAKKKKPDVSMAAIEQTDLPSIGAGLINVPSIEAPTSVGKAVITLAAPTLTQDASTEILPTIEEQDNEVVIIEAPIIPAQPIISQVPSMFEIGSESQQPTATQVPPSPDWALAPVERPPSQWQGKASATSIRSVAPTKSQTPSGSSGSINIQIPIGESAFQKLTLTKHLIEAIRLPANKWIQKNQTLNEIFSSFYSAMISAAHDVSTLDKRFRSYADTSKKWLDQMAAIKAERDSTHEHLQATSNRAKEMEERKKRLEEENSRLMAELELARANMESANSDLDSAHSELEAMWSKLALVQADKESTEWIIET
ncbi:hypothetical protein COCNU_06G020770 [Cocos nucifera]|uniref:Uncharacterized protein n=1 Tax=Cocos nucifera TaxID=13894 RepID=A0A8K0N3Q6_COCNU|nr:hypothetical protein COCNU_06G020770 [Cocos nucifera]